MDPKRPRTADESALESEPIRRSAGQPAGEKRPEPPTEAVTDDQVTDAAATSDALDPADLFGSLDVGAQATPNVVPDSSAERRSLEFAADNMPASAGSVASDAALSPPPIEEIATSLRSPSIADVPAASVARDMVATWQDLPADLGSQNDDATTDRQASTNDGVPGVDSQPAQASVDVGGFMTTDLVVTPSGANEDFDYSDRTPGTNPPDYIAIGNYLGPSNDPTVIERGPLRTNNDSWRPSIELLSNTRGDSDVPERPSDSELSPRATRLQSPASDGGPPLARPILLASVPDQETRRILDEALVEAGRRDAKTLAEIAQKQVDDAFWLRACEERALYRGR